MRRSRFRHPLQPQLAWIIRLRWMAGIAMAGAGAADGLIYHWQPGSLRILPLGLAILIYNGAFRMAQKRQVNPSRRRLLLLAGAQIVLDLLCLCVLISWTGGLGSPLLGFFVFHMIFASVLLTRRLAYASAAVALILLSAVLALNRELPSGHAQDLTFLGLGLTLILTVTFTNHITRDLRRHRRLLMRQNRRIRTMTNRLRQNQKTMILQEKMVALGQMAAGVAHEVTNPLANMDSLLQLAQRNPARMNVETIGTLREQIARINSIVHQMQSFAHPTDGELEKLPLNDVVAKSVQMVRMDARARKAHLEPDLSSEVGLARIRPQALQQALVNLMLNALDAMADVPAPRLVVTTRRVGQWYTIEVADNGSGIKPEHMNRLFEPFFTTKPVGKGTGLGLSISYKLIQRQGGSIEVKSDVGVGTTMTIRLPAGAGQTAGETVAKMA